MTVPHQTAIDTIAIQIDFDTAEIQREILQNILNSVGKSSPAYIDSKEYAVDININRVEHYLYANNTTVATINTGAFRSGSSINDDYKMKYYINIKFAGLRKYNAMIDASSHSYLLMICAYLNTNDIGFKLTELDICIDSMCKLEHILSVCTKKSPKTKYHELADAPFPHGTKYIEKIKQEKLNKAVLRAYTYDKSLKEGLPYPMTRFEIKLQAKYFNKYGFSMQAIKNALDRYHVMYFEDIEEKNRKMKAYSKYTCVRKREINRLKISEYRLYADMGHIEHFINKIHTVNNHNLYMLIQSYNLIILGIHVPILNQESNTST